MSKYAMSISLNVLNHLGINLYSNSVAVITETVANSWDADAKTVNIDINDSEKTISINDDGTGMDIMDINQRFLNIGYDRRKSDETKTKMGRDVMGRKGLGKLSLFSIAKSIEIYTKKENGNINAFKIDVDAIEKQINSVEKNHDFAYNPTEITTIPPNVVKDKSGTTIILRNLKSTRITSESQLRARLARRFSVIGPAHKFTVKVNESDISVSERKYYKKLQYIWMLGDAKYKEELSIKCGGSLKRTLHAENTIAELPGQTITGWIGTVKSTSDLKDSDAGNLNGIVLLARGRLIQENVLDTFSDGRLYSKYVIGEINADFLDDNSRPDIATSSRQSLIEDDERFVALKNHIKKILSDIGKNWTEYRNLDGAEEVTAKYPKIDEWLKSFNGKTDTKKAALKIIGHIQSLPADNEDDKKELLKHGILAFERLRVTDELSKLESLIPFDSKQFRAIVANIDDIEASLYHQIVKERVEIINALEKLTDINALEREIQEHIFKHLWLLDPSWERATGSEVMEQSVAKEFGLITTLSDEELKGRLDIRYKKSAGSHVIIELKRSARKCTTLELYTQGDKYVNALKKCLTKENELTPFIEVIFLLGEPPSETNPGQKEMLFRNINARSMTYGEILHTAKMSYADYLKKHADVGAIREIILSL